MKDDELRAAFESALTANPYDTLTHAALADFLEERGLDAEAQAHRNWTAKQEGLDRLKEMAQEMNDYYDDMGWDSEELEPSEGPSGFRRVSVETLLVAGQRAVKGGEWCFSRDHDPQYLYREEERFWLHWHHATGEAVPHEESERRTSWRCSC